MGGCPGMTGAMTTTAEQMQMALDLKEALLKVYDPEAIILFGSLGRGDGDEFSDVDLLIVIETDRDIKDLGEEMTRYLDPLVRDKHILVRTPEEFCRQMDIPGTLVFSVVNEGKVLFEKAGWQNHYRSKDSYETRKQEVMEQDYGRSARDFHAQAKSALEKGNLFRCRDLVRFSAARALKGLFVKNNIHPPRETDLVSLLDKIREMEPELGCHAPFLKELNDYCPNGNNTLESQVCRSMVEKTAAFVKEVMGRCFTAP
jgi:predicted nucleotidyltransferase/HEPN domain-containing protein